MNYSPRCRYCPYLPAKSVDRWGNEVMADGSLKLVEGYHVVAWRAMDDGAFTEECFIPFADLGYPKPERWVWFLDYCPFTEYVGGYWTSSIPAESPLWQPWLADWYSN